VIQIRSSYRPENRGQGIPRCQAAPAKAAPRGAFSSRMSKTVFTHTPHYLYEGMGQKVHQRNKNAWDDLQRTGQVDTSRLARFRYTTLVIFCQETADRRLTQREHRTCCYLAFRETGCHPVLQPEQPGRAKLQILSISRKCCQPVTRLLPRCEQLLQGKVESYNRRV
jgi:hypothetical protein